MEALVKGGVSTGAIVAVKIDVEAGVELPIFKKLRFKTQPGTTRFDVISPDRFWIYLFETRGIKAIATRLAVDRLEMETAGELEKLDHRIIVVFVKHGGGPRSIPSCIAGEFAD